jgi:hypothetical protein
MEATKAENMVEHGAEIAARPPKTWFQSTREKAAVAERWAPFWRSEAWRRHPKPWLNQTTYIEDSYRPGAAPAGTLR